MEVQTVVQISESKYHTRGLLKALKQLQLLFFLNRWNVVRFQVLTATSVKMTVFWDVAHCRVIEATSDSQVLAAIALMM
jgi:hypothetical protein